MPNVRYPLGGGHPHRRVERRKTNAVRKVKRPHVGVNRSAYFPGFRPGMSPVLEGRSLLYYLAFLLWFRSLGYFRFLRRFFAGAAFCVRRYCSATIR